MLKKLLYLLLFIFPISAGAWRIQGRILILEKGDILWDVAHSLYGRGFDYKRIWKNRLDKHISDNPNQVYDGMRFLLDSLPPIGEVEEMPVGAKNIVIYNNPKGPNSNDSTIVSESLRLNRNVEDTSIRKILADCLKILLPLFVVWGMRKIKGPEKEAGGQLGLFIIRALAISYLGIILYTVADNVHYTQIHFSHFGSDTLVQIQLKDTSMITRPNKTRKMPEPFIISYIERYWLSYLAMIGLIALSLSLLMIIMRVFFPRFQALLKYSLLSYRIRHIIGSEKEKTHAYNYLVNLLLLLPGVSRSRIQGSFRRYLLLRLEIWMALNGEIYLTEKTHFGMNLFIFEFEKRKEILKEEVTEQLRKIQNDFFPKEA